MQHSRTRSSVNLPLLEAFFPGQPPLTSFEFSPVASDQTRQVVQDAVALSKAGLKVDGNELSDKNRILIERGGSAFAKGFHLRLGYGGQAGLTALRLEDGVCVGAGR